MRLGLFRILGDSKNLNGDPAIAKRMGFQVAAAVAFMFSKRASNLGLGL